MSRQLSLLKAWVWIALLACATLSKTYQDISCGKQLQKSYYVLFTLFAGSRVEPAAPSSSNNMKVFVIGGTTVPPANDEYPKQLKILEQSMRPLGKCLIDNNHELLVCSPYQGSADVETIRGATQSANVKRGKHIEFHYPRAESISTEVNTLIKTLSIKQARSFFHLP